MVTVLTYHRPIAITLVGTIPVFLLLLTITATFYYSRLQGRGLGVPTHDLQTEAGGSRIRYPKGPMEP